MFNPGCAPESIMKMCCCFFIQTHYMGDRSSELASKKHETVDDSNEPHHEKTCIRGLRPGKTQTGLLSYRD